MIPKRFHVIMRFDYRLMVMVVTVSFCSRVNSVWYDTDPQDFQFSRAHEVAKPLLRFMGAA